VLHLGTDIVDDFTTVKAVWHAKSHNTLLRVLNPKKYFKRQLNTLRVLLSVLKREKDLKEVLLANTPTRIIPRDMFQSYCAEFLKIKETFGLSKQWVQRVKIFSCVHGPIALLQGPPCTDKTYVAAHIVASLLCQSNPVKVLIVSRSIARSMFSLPDSWMRSRKTPAQTM
jgi:hypothetical protein